MDAARKLDENRRRILDGDLMNGIRQDAGGAAWLAKEKIQGVDAMRGDVVERAAARPSGIEEPVFGPVRALRLQPGVAIGFGKEGLADGSLRHELPGTQELGKEPAVIRDGEEAVAGTRRGHHRLSLRVVHRGRFFAEDVFAGLKGGDGLRAVKKDWRRHVDGIDGSMAQRVLKGGESLHSRIRRGLARIAGEKRLEARAWLLKNGRNHPAGCDVSNSNDQPINHGLNQRIPI
jgi:hypothetical protein